ncbi:PIN domain-containing protein [Sulfuracidifex tepidarius]|uniref:Ribonuclease VapC9 n=1 Tax=Sulfuracidifex tepidarius TaxID=1294262 RepID=A0A510DVG1_9CREN|nr:PIN domain-containing protein [Sulfuracidifex tepidarius]BBG24201.1 Ribonuclease VapC9 [Sulfuracidifex tepidarius]BBG26958.1 Ribonuclease VapC9 [Sulfuracidifex tepidarius]
MTERGSLREKEREKEGVLLDTNILLYIYEGFDPFLSILERFDYKPDFFIHSAVVNELTTLKGREKGFSMNARINVAMAYLDKFSNMWKKLDLPCSGKVDNCLIETASKMNFVLMTNDREMKQRALEKGVRVLYVQGKGKIIKSLTPL